MNEDMIMEVYVSIDGDNKGNIATAYPIARDRLLTARHVLNLKNNRPQGVIKVRWHHLKERAGYGWQEATFIDCGLDPELDVALLDCTFPDDIEISYPSLLQQPPSGPFEWCSSGFPDAGKMHYFRKLTALWGSGMSEGKNLALEVKAPVAEDKEWQGASGSPVFIHSRNTIAGVVLTCPKKFSAARLHAVPIWKLLEHEEFVREVEFFQAVDWLEELRDEIRWLISQHPELVDKLADALRLPESDRSNMDKILLEDKSIDQLIPAFKKVGDLLSRRDQKDQALKLRSILYHLLPLRFDLSVIRQVSSSTHAICSVDIGTRPVAEIVMAARDGRAVSMRHNPGDKVPTGVCFLDQPGESQMSIEDRLEEFTEQLTKRFGHGDALEPGQEGVLQALIQLTVSELEYQAESEQRTYYYIYTLPSDPAERNYWIKLFQQVKDRFPPIVFLDISDATDVVDRDRKYFRPLIDFHSLQTKD